MVGWVGVWVKCIRFLKKKKVTSEKDKDMILNGGRVQTSANMIQNGTRKASESVSRLPK